MNIRIHRIYEYTEPQNEIRILVDRLWPRGISKAEARLDDWWKDVAPQSELRKWFNHEPEKWPEFQERYLAELDANRELLVEHMKALDLHKPIVLLYGARDKEHNQAVVLKAYLEKNFS